VVCVCECLEGKRGKVGTAVEHRCVDHWALEMYKQKESTSDLQTFIYRPQRSASEWMGIATLLPRTLESIRSCERHKYMNRQQAATGA
jgi:hypothetical protein